MLTVDFDRLGLRPGDRVLDMGCGAGRHAFEVYRRGGDVIAFDMDADELAKVSDLFHADRGWRRTLAVEYVVLVALAFAFFYPLYAFVGLDAHDLELRLWLPSWR